VLPEVVVSWCRVDSVVFACRKVIVYLCSWLVWVEVSVR
jgi:hypothetical protein